MIVSFNFKGCCFKIVYGTARTKYWYLGRNEDFFSKKYKYYYKARKTRDEIFRMIQRADETLEHYAKRFQFSYKPATNHKLDDESLKLVLLSGVREDLMEALHLIVVGDTYQFTYDEIKDLFKN